VVLAAVAQAAEEAQEAGRSKYEISFMLWQIFLNQCFSGKAKKRQKLKLPIFQLKKLQTDLQDIILKNIYDKIYKKQFFQIS
jgi:hypothetical protein